MSCLALSELSADQLSQMSIERLQRLLAERRRTAIERMQRDVARVLANFPAVAVAPEVSA